MLMRLIITGIVVTYAYKGIFIASKSWSPIWKWSIGVVYWGFAALVVGLIIYMSYNWSDMRMNHPGWYNFALGAFFTLFFTCTIIGVFHLLDDLVWVFNWIRSKFSSSGGESVGNKISRAEFLTKTGMILGGIVFGSFLYGITRGKYAFRVLSQNLSFPNLPDEFDGLRVVQISDAHLGSFTNNTTPIEKAIEMVNGLNADYIFFTGDMINSHHSEALPWVDIFKRLKSKYGNYAILGNHDYGYYGNHTEAEQAQIKEEVVKIVQQMGFTTLLNEGVQLERNGQVINLLGVENWGKSHWFPKLGDVDKAMEGLNSEDFNILLSHDPTHWDEHVLGKHDIELTLSGHTHGAQMGLRVPGVLEISPAQLMFKRWAGLYEEGKQKLYINRGFGFLMFPGRVGMAPEITLFELNKA